MVAPFAGEFEPANGWPSAFLQGPRGIRQAAHEAESVYWNRCYKPWRVTRDSRIEAALSDNGVTVESDNGSLLWEPWEVLKKHGTPYRVFTPFSVTAAWLSTAPRKPLDRPQSLTYAESTDDMAVDLEALNLLPKICWDAKV